MMDYDPKNKIRFAHLTNNCLVKKFQKLDQSSPLKNGGKQNKDDSASTSKKTNHTTENYEEDQTESEEDDVSDGEEPDSIWSNDDFSRHLQQGF